MDTLAELRKQLLAHGYSPLPLNGKSPAPMSGWQEKFQTNDAEIELWDTMYPQNRNTGVLTRITPALDIDLLDEAAAVAVEELARERLGEGGRFLLRIGQPPKRLIPLRAAEPFKKITLNLIAGNGRKDGKIEVLGDGQQMAVHGMHPTGKPYTWFGAELWTVPAAELPLVDEAGMRGFLDDVGKLLVAEYDYQIAGGSNRFGADDDGDGGGRDWGDCITGILNGEALHDNIAVLAAKQIAAGIDAGVIVNLIRDLMTRSQAPHDERWQERLDDIPRAVASAQRKFSRPPDAPDDDQEIEKLARMVALDYERARAAAAKLLGVRAPMLDKLVALKRAELGLDGDDRGQGRPIELPEPTPWETPVDGAELLDAVAAAIRRHVVLPDYACDAIALWSAHTYLLDRLMITPRLAITSPTKGCGKTTLLDVVSQLVFRPLAAANCSASSIFRVVEGFRPCLLIDEADSFLSGNEELRGILNSGHRRGGAVLRNVGDDHEPHSFSTFSACAIGLIGRLPGTLADRAVPIDLVRRKADEAIEPFRFDRVDHLAVLARKLMRWTKDNADAVAATEPEMPAGLYNRAADNWRGLLAIATVAGGDWLARGHRAALQGAGADVDESSRIELLLGDVRDILDEHGLDRIASDTLIEHLCEITPRPWSEFGRSGKPITANKLARQLRPLGIAPVLMRIGTEERARGYARHQFTEAWARYLPPEGVSNRDSVTNAENTGTSGTFQSVTADRDVTVEKSQKSNNDGLCHGVTVRKGGSEEKGLSAREIDAQAELYADDFYRRRDEPDIEAELNRELRQRLVNELGVRPEHVETEFRRVIDAVFRISDARTRQSFEEGGATPTAENDPCVCTYCGRPGGNRVAWGDIELTLHRGCEIPYIDKRMAEEGIAP